MVSVIAAALAGHQWYDATTDSEDPATGCTGCDDWFSDEYAVENGIFAAHQARAVLAAISEAGAVEWGVFRKSDALAAGAFDEAIFKTKAAADAFIKLGFLPHVVERVEPRSRLTFPWTPTVAWGVSYKGRVYPYESEDEARRQLRLAQMDVPAMLVTKVGDGEWVEVEG